MGIGKKNFKLPYTDCLKWMCKATSVKSHSVDIAVAFLPVVPLQGMDIPGQNKSKSIYWYNFYITIMI